MRSKREKRLRAIRREIVEPYYEKKEEAKLAAQEAALAAPKLQVPVPPKTDMEVSTFAINNNSMALLMNTMVLFWSLGGESFERKKNRRMKWKEWRDLGGGGHLWVYVSS
ncbi:hypothetical protein A2U01_0035175 [Trifolium medium]|uniref:Uncharacterized protein n=1 Tax=Trifolium medium TaxID=97028 RepID=A0A392PPN0_9FABA|nr:hypothetical protein [Trifolium medium]